MKQNERSLKNNNAMYVHFFRKNKYDNKPEKRKSLW